MGKIPRHYFLLFVVLVIAIGMLWSVCGNDFIAYDDEINIYGNHFVTTFSLANIYYFWAGFYQNLYIPLTYNLWTVLAGIASCFPASSDSIISPFPFHATNLLLHLGSTVMVFFIARVLIGDDWGAAGGALLFAVHPIQVEAVAWATGLKDVLSGFLALLAVWQYLVYAGLTDDRRSQLLHYALAGVAFVGAILAKPGTVALPFAVALIGFLLMFRSPRLLLRELAPWLLAAFPVLLLTKLAQPVTGQSFHPAAWQRLLVAGDAWTFYLAKFLWPWQLGPDYGRTPQLVLEQGWPIWLTGLAPYLLLGLVFLRGNRYCQVAVGVSLAMLLPVSGLVAFDFQDYSTVADRYFYTAMLGPALGVGWLVRFCRGRTFLLVGMAIILILCGIRSSAQVRHWQNGVTFYRNALEVNPRSWLAANNLGVIFFDRNQLPEAGQLLEQSIAWKPDYSVALNNLGAVYGLQGRLLEAQRLFARALNLDPNYADAAANLGDIYLRRGDVVRAREYYQRALSVKPDFAKVHVALGDISSGERQFAEALKHYQLALGAGPASLKLLNNLGLVYKELGRVEDAAACYRRALALAPDSAEVHNNLGLIHHEAGRYQEAISEFEQAGRLRPDQPQPFCNLGKALMAVGQVETAKVAFVKALSLNPGYAPALFGLARLYRMIGREDLANDYARKANALGFHGDEPPRGVISRL